MIEALTTLRALADHGTMARAGEHLRCSQSTVSKRIHALERELGFPLLESRGRRVVLRPAARRLLERSAEPLAALRAALTGDEDLPLTTLSIGVSESILASWGAAALGRARDRLEVELEVHAHRSPLVLQRVLSGELQLGLVAGDGAGPRLAHLAVGTEPLVLVPCGLRPLRLRGGRVLEVLTIEPGSATWRATEGARERLEAERGLVLEPVRTVESFAAAVQMARAGFGHGLVPLRLARAMGVAARALVALPRPGLARPLVLAGRPGLLARRTVERMAGLLGRACEAG